MLKRYYRWKKDKVEKEALEILINCKGKQNQAIFQSLLLSLGAWTFSAAVFFTLDWFTRGVINIDPTSVSFIIYIAIDALWTIREIIHFSNTSKNVTYLDI
jgi:hypothetical protein